MRLKCTYICVILFLGGTQINAQTVIDTKGTKIIIDTSKWTKSGSNIYNKNTGNVGIGISNPLYKLDVNATSNPLRLQGLVSGLATDSILTTLNGVVRKITASQLFVDSTTASNGLTLNGKNVQLGGNLTQATTITNNGNALTIATGGSAVNITSLPGGSVTDSLVMINHITGQLKKLNISELQSKVIEIYDAAGTQALTTSFTNLNLGTTSIIDNGYSTASGVITVANAGLYRITYRVTARVTNNTAAGAQFRLTNGGTEIVGTSGYTYHASNSRPQGTVTVVKIINLAANSTIAVQGKRYTSSGNISLTANGSSLIIERIR